MFTAYCVLSCCRCVVYRLRQRLNSGLRCHCAVVAGARVAKRSDCIRVCNAVENISLLTGGAPSWHRGISVGKEWKALTLINEESKHRTWLRGPTLRCGRMTR